MQQESEDSEFYHGQFPEDFIWSVATSSYQIEGGWDEDGKGPNIWDTFCHKEGTIVDGSSGDVACDSYHRYLEDIQLVKNLGVSHYRFSISWSRILPLGTVTRVNKAGVEYYDKVIDACLQQGIQPIVTLYHWDLPQALQDWGGWLNEDIIKHFAYYAQTCFSYFGDRVKWWQTFNEPFVMCWLGYGNGFHAPGIKEPGTAPYKAAHTVIKAHARVYHLYKKEFQHMQGGYVGITLNTEWKEPFNAKDGNDVTAASRAMHFKLGWFANPIFGNGDYPYEMKEQIAQKCMQQGLSETRLPTFTKDEKNTIRGSSDFMGMNHYTTRLVHQTSQPSGEVSYVTDQDMEESQKDEWPITGTPSKRVVPWGMRKLLNWIKEHYNNVPVFIMENGVSDRSGQLDDTHRINYLKGYINEVLKARNMDHCNIIGYTAWSLLDNFEWAEGYAERWGLHHVDFNHPNRTRTPKSSATFYTNIVRNNGFPAGTSSENETT